FVFCFFGPVFWQADPNQNNVLSVTDTLSPPTLAHPFGTDDVGRDTLARAMAGGRVSLSVGLLSMLLAIVFGVGIGSFAGYYGGAVDNILMRFTDVVLAVLLYLLLFVLSASLTEGPPRSVVI